MRNSRQRQIIETVIRQRTDHPTAAEVCSDAHQFDETISLATVYRNLNLMVEQGKINKLHMLDGVDHFDPIPDNHSHFYCKKCKKISNIKLRKSKLTLTGTGTINNVAGYAGVFNNGKTTINGDITISHTGGYYAVLNHGEMIINKAKITADADTNSVVVNGYYSYGNTSNHREGYVEGVAHANPKMTLGSGVVIDGTNAINGTIKNDDGGVMTINGGNYTASGAGAFQNANKATINGGTFTQTNAEKPLLYNQHYAGGNNEGILEINGGLFKYAEDTFVETTEGSKITIKGGAFSFAPEEEYIADGVEFEENDNHLWTVKAPTELPEDNEEEEEKNPATADNLFTFVAIFAGALVTLGATLVASKRV